MITIKDVKKYLTKNNFYKISKEDIKTLQNLLLRSGRLSKYYYKDGDVLEDDLIKKVLFINNNTFNKLYDIFKKSVKKDYHSNPYIIFYFFTLEESFKHSNVIPITFYHDEKDYEIRENKIKINIEDFILSFKTIEANTKQIVNFLKNVRPDINFKIKGKKIDTKPIPIPDLIPKKKVKSKPIPTSDLIPKKTVKSKPKKIKIPESKAVKDLIKVIKNPHTKDIVGISLNKIKNLSEEDVIAFTWFLKHLINLS